MFKIIGLIERLAFLPIIVPIEEPDEFTEIVFEELTLDIPLDDNFFAKSALKRR